MSERGLAGLAASPGVAVGPAFIFQAAGLIINQVRADDPGMEWARVRGALAATHAQLAALHTLALGRVGGADAAIFEAHQMFLEDEEYLGAMQRAVDEEHRRAEAAVESATKFYADMLLGLDDEYLQARAADLRDVGSRIIRNLNGGGDSGADALKQPSIILAEDLTPSDTIQFPREWVLGLCTAKGGPTSHVAILSRSLGVPAVVSAPINLSEFSDGELLILDGSTGAVTQNPHQDSITQAQKKRQSWLSAQATARAATHLPAITTDGAHPDIVANIGNVQDAIESVDNGAEGVGLFRTEFLFMGREALPSEDEQVHAYREIARVLAGRPLVARMLDVGGDKAVSYLSVEPEPNPFLGWRAIRMLDGREDIYLTQMRALLRACASDSDLRPDLRIMLPMVSSMSELERGRALLTRACEALDTQKIPRAQRIQFGIMVEVPSAALLANAFAPHVDFFSIGTNDLTQYTLAVDRGNARVASLASPFHPAVLRLIQMTIDAAHAHGKWCGVCGELGGDVLAAPMLLGMGLDEFSMSASAIPVMKATLRKLSRVDCARVAAQVLSLSTTRDVIAYLQSLA